MLLGYKNVFGDRKQTNAYMQKNKKTKSEIRFDGV